MQIEAIMPPWIFTDDGCRLAMSSVEGNLQKGAVLELTARGYRVIGVQDVECEM